MGAAVSAGADNDELVDNLLEAEYIRTLAVERVFRAVDRGHYFSVDSKNNAYKDLAWKCGDVHISAPCIYSEVMENLKLAPGMSFLNLGSGTGYLSTMAGLMLGSYGVNHGVEIHEDVLNYANKKLDEFCSTSSAPDEYEFCRPRFIYGNCLRLGSDARQYDRVYCGAACPEKHENYMKNLIKVGGILVMPIRNQLVQIYRISDNNWKTKSLLPVSFASLICSNVPGGGEPLKMPDTNPLSLQEICRFAVRSILRRKIDTEHPELKRRHFRVKRKKLKKRTTRKFMLPIFRGDSDSEDNNDETEYKDAMRDCEMTGFCMNVLGARPCRTSLEPVPGPSGGDGEDDDEEGGEEEDEEEDEEEEEEDEEEKEGEEDEEEEEEEEEVEEETGGGGGGGGEEEDLNEDGSDEGKSDVEMEDKPDRRSKKREKFDSGIVEDIEKGNTTDSDGETRRDENLFEDSDTEPAASETSTCKPDEAKCENVKNYSSYMKENIKMLPLPMTLKYFVNFDKEL